MNKPSETMLRAMLGYANVHRGVGRGTDVPQGQPRTEAALERRGLVEEYREPRLGQGYDGGAVKAARLTGEGWRALAKYAPSHVTSDLCGKHGYPRIPSCPKCDQAERRAARNTETVADLATSLGIREQVAEETTSQRDEREAREYHAEATYHRGPFESCDRSPCVRYNTPTASFGETIPMPAQVADLFSGEGATPVVEVAPFIITPRGQQMIDWLGNHPGQAFSGAYASDWDTAWDMYALAYAIKGTDVTAPVRGLLEGIATDKGYSLWDLERMVRDDMPEPPPATWMCKYATRAGNIGASDWLRTIWAANSVEPRFFAEPTNEQWSGGREVERYPHADVIHVVPEGSTLITATDAHGADVLRRAYELVKACRGAGCGKRHVAPCTATW